MRHRIGLWLFGMIAFALVPMAWAEEPASSAVVETKSDMPKADLQLEKPTNLAGVFSKELVEKLDSEQLYDLARRKLIEENARQSFGEESVVPVVFFLLVFLLVGTSLYFGFRKDRQRHETLRNMIEKGMTIPPELIRSPVRKRSALRLGILFLSSGIGFGLFMLSLGLIDRNAMAGAGVGIVPIFIGLGYLLIWKLEKKSNGTSNDSMPA